MRVHDSPIVSCILCSYKSTMFYAHFPTWEGGGWERILQDDPQSILSVGLPLGNVDITHKLKYQSIHALIILLISMMVLLLCSRGCDSRLKNFLCELNGSMMIYRGRKDWFLRFLSSLSRYAFYMLVCLNFPVMTYLLNRSWSLYTLGVLEKSSFSERSWKNCKSCLICGSIISISHLLQKSDTFDLSTKIWMKMGTPQHRLNGTHSESCIHINNYLKSRH